MIVEYDGDKLQMDHEYVRLVTNIEDSIRKELNNVDWDTLNDRIGDEDRIEMLVMLQKLYFKAKIFNEISNLPTGG